LGAPSHPKVVQKFLLEADCRYTKWTLPGEINLSTDQAGELMQGARHLHNSGMVDIGLCFDP